MKKRTSDTTTPLRSAEPKEKKEEGTITKSVLPRSFVQNGRCNVAIITVHQKIQGKFSPSEDKQKKLVRAADDSSAPIAPPSIRSLLQLWTRPDTDSGHCRHADVKFYFFLLFIYRRAADLNINTS
jgi:hypothetical protein